MAEIQKKRIYEPAEPADGFRVLADRLWPRGIKKENAGIDLWAKDIAPSTALRKDFHGGSIDWPEFQDRYRMELWDNPAVDAFARAVQGKETVTLLFAGKDTEHTHVNVIKEVLLQLLRE